MTSVSIIVAKSLNNVIGIDNEIPWIEPEDMKYFRELTTGGTVIMGRNTWESIPGRPLKDRTNIVVSSYRLQGPDYVAKSLEAALEVASGNIFIIGGARLYEEALQIADSLYITVVRERITSFSKNIVHFPEVDYNQWNLEYSTMSPEQTVIFKKYNRRANNVRHI